MQFEGDQIKGVLLDITGVLLDSSSECGSTPVQGSVGAVQRLKEAGMPVRFVTNETQKTRAVICQKLNEHGFNVNEGQIFSPPLAMAKVAKEKSLRPHFVVHPNCLPDLGGIDTKEPNCVVLGDAVDGFSYKSLNDAFKTLIKTGGDLYCLGKGKYYREDGGLTLDVGPFAAALEFATERTAIIVGKPSPDFFATAIEDIGVRPEEAVMVGDDLVSDVGGAQRCGSRGVLVRTGKYRPADEDHPAVKPDLTVDNLSQFVDLLLRSTS